MPDDLYDRLRNLFVAGFIGAPPMNFLTGTIEDGALQVSLGRLAIDSPLARRLGAAQRGDRVILGICPEDFSEGGELKAVADVVESTGFDVFVHVRLLGEEIAATAESVGIGLLSELVARYEARTPIRTNT